MTLFLSGPMGTGKTTLGRAYVARWGGRFVDLDEAIEARQGASVRALFTTLGDAGFRAIERAVVKEIASEENAVVALGGGTVTDRATRRALLKAGRLVTLRAPVDVLVARLAGDATRPLLDGASEDRAAVLGRLLRERAAAYGECHETIDTGAWEQDDVTAELRRVALADWLVVPLGERSYPIDVATLASAHAHVAHRAIASSIVIVTDENARAHATRARSELEQLGKPVTEVVLTPGEANKTLAAVETIWERALDAGVDRDALVLAVGGGVVGDVAGFAASTLLRGVAFAQIPTTLLAMVDASVGGKTGIDRARGKNLVGTFYQPRFVLVDVDTLATLPERELRSGFAEVIKAAWLEGEDDVAALEHDAEALARRDPDALTCAIRRAVATKIAIVSEDEHETGIRMHLNLGHTLGHAIEAASGYTRTHGECVALGLIAAMRIGVSLGDADRGALERLVALLGALGLPTDLDTALDDTRVAPFLGADKKRSADRVRFVVPGAPGHVRVEPLEIPRILRLAGR